MPEYKIVDHGIIVDCSSLHFGPFSVVILPETDSEHSFYLRHKKYCILKYMFTLVESETLELVEIAYNNAPQYIPDFIQECFSETE